MDKLKLLFQKIVNWFNNLSIKHSYIAYITISLIVSALIGAIIMSGISEMKSYIYIYDQYQITYNKVQTYTYKMVEDEVLHVKELENEVEYIIMDTSNYTSVTISVYKNEQKEVEVLRDKQGVLKALVIKEHIVVTTSILDFVLGALLIMTLPIAFFIGCIVCSILFFKYKLNPPIQILMDASNKISDNELDFTVEYDNQDEMGQLCDSFEMMRDALYENQKELWRNIEERKRLNSAFSHDLRTPLTVLKGYSEMLLMAIDADSINKDNMRQTVTTISKNIERLERYTYEMSRMQKLEDISVNKEKKSTALLLSHLKEAGEILSGDLNFYFNCNIEALSVDLDLELVMQVYENLMANSKRYARASIWVTCTIINKELVIEVADDGQGFTKEGLLKATNPFYKEQENVDNAHFGLGLHICRLLTEKHGGDLKVANHQRGGAQITANFGKVI
ncbi:MAG TPA: hypothetical protein DCY20_04390 [Firmicutes bacterium]|nr:hypothetical protein [Bacillota bacterium]